MDNLFEDYMAARCKIKALKRTIEEFKTGERYMKLQRDYHRVTNGHIKEIKQLKLEIGRLNARMISIRNMWSDDCYAMYEEKQAEIRNLKETIRRLEDKVWEERRNSDEKNIKLALEYGDRLHEKDCIIDELMNRLAHAKALLSGDGSNTGLPTSKTPPGRKKRIPNTREKSNKPKGGQPGHEKHELGKPDESVITDVIEHDSDEEDFLCPRCDGDSFIPTGECDIKYEYDVEVVVKKIKHVFYRYQCLDCGTVFVSKSPVHLRGDVGYGKTLQALALTLTNNVNAAMNKNAMFLAGITHGDLTPCEGYIAKLQKRAANGLVQFCSDPKQLLINGHTM